MNVNLSLSRAATNFPEAHADGQNQPDHLILCAQRAWEGMVTPVPAASQYHRLPGPEDTVPTVPGHYAAGSKSHGTACPERSHQQKTRTGRQRGWRRKRPRSLQCLPGLHSQRLLWLILGAAGQCWKSNDSGLNDGSLSANMRPHSSPGQAARPQTATS